MTDENYEASAQAHLASLKRDMRVSLEDAAVRAMHKVMAEFEAKSDQRLMEMPEKFAGFDVVVDASLPPGTMKFEQPAPKIEANRPEPLTGGDERRHIICLCPDCTKPAQPQQELVGCIPSHWVDKAKQIADGPIAYPNAERAQQAIALIKILLKSTPPARKPLTHEQRVDLLDKFEAHKHEWHAPAILIDMVEAAHGIKETP